MWTRQVLGACVREGEFQSGFQLNDSFSQILYAELLFDHGGVESHGMMSFWWDE